MFLNLKSKNKTFCSAFFLGKKGRGTKKVEDSVFERKKRKKEKKKKKRVPRRKAKKEGWFRKSDPLNKRGREEGPR